MTLRPFKFLRCPLTETHDGGLIYAGDIFYTMNKVEIVSVSGRIIPKYVIVRRCIPKKFQEKFKPDHEVLWYFRSRSNAEWLKTIWTREDNQLSGGEAFHRMSDMLITFRGNN
jgi:hypothetical protein